ncbi:MAG TPA: type II toxin-antitoxin system RelE/ParE family toxin [Planctomycetaceae bacterium]|nr:type II toxin-antitoxin system RelE/ParE family toxin [Planctomycetaceae bacterium]
MPACDLHFTDEALADLTVLRTFDQNRVTDAIESQLLHQPDVESRNRKRLRPNQLAEWELRIDNLRVFFDVRPSAPSVNIVAVGWKQGEKLFIHGQPYQL